MTDFIAVCRYTDIKSVDLANVVIHKKCLIMTELAPGNTKGNSGH